MLAARSRVYRGKTLSRVGELAQADLACIAAVTQAAAALLQPLKQKIRQSISSVGSELVFWGCYVGLLRLGRSLFYSSGWLGYASFGKLKM